MQEDQNPQTNDAAEQEAPVSSPAGEQTLATPDQAAGAERKGAGRKVRTGVVVSNKMQKSIVVAVVRRVRHPLYKKYFNKTKKYMAHDEANQCQIGDTVRIIETRPLSARKRWRLDSVIERAK